MSRTFFITLTALLLTPLAALHAADASVSELVLARDFGLGELRQMPRPVSNQWQLEKRDYSAEHAIEWQVRLQAPANSDSPLYEDVKSADFVVRFPAEQGVTLHWSKGSHTDATDFQPRVETLTAGGLFALESFGGRSSDGAMPYFNLASEGGGLIVAVGWSGDWKASFESLGGGKVRVTAGLKRSHFKLPAGERVRLPSVLVMSYRGDWLAGQNQFRHLMLRHFTPASHPPMQLMPVAASVHGMVGFNATTQEKLTALAADITALKLPLDTFWLDAGWTEGGFPRAQGNPNADPVRFPHGLGPVGAAAGQAGMRFLVWFEPERAMAGTWLDRERPAWLFSPNDTPPELRYMEKDGFRLLDLGNANARKWALDSISRHIREAGISVYRQDFNEYPAFFWHTDEPPGEAGLREVRHINGLYDFLEELARRHPGLILDNCASGGRRLDFEMMRRSVVLWRSDSCWDAKSFPRNVQAMTHGLSHWLPLHGLGAHTTDDVALRSGMGACATYAVNYRDPVAVAALRKHLDLYLRVRPLFAADFHPLTEWSGDPARWLAFQFHDPAKGEGIVQAFCGADAPRRSPALKLRGLDPHKRYTIQDWDHPAAPLQRSGLELSNAGIEVQALGINGAVVLHYTSTARLLPPGWNAKQAADKVLEGLIKVTAPQVKGAHDAGMALVNDRAFIVVEVNDEKASESAGWPFIYAAMSIVKLNPLAVEKVIPFARSAQFFENETLPPGACFVPRIIRKDDQTLRCYFASEAPGARQAQTWFTDFDIGRMAFENRIHRAKIKTAAGVFDMQPQRFHDDAVAHGFTRKPKDHGLYIFDSFKVFDGKTYVALNNYPGGQNALAVLNPDMDTFEVLGHYNEPQEWMLTESAVNRLPDGTWMAICRQEGGNRNYTFTTSKDGRHWTPNQHRDFVPNGTSSKPTFDRFKGLYYLGWQESTRIAGVSRSVFNVEVSADGMHWERKYRFETEKSFQYPTFHEHQGAVYLTVTQGDSDPSRKERIMFGKLE